MGKSIVYHAMELNPLSWSTVNELGYHEFLQLSDKHCEKFKLMHMANWEEENKIEPGFILQKFNASIRNFVPGNNYDLVYFDAFAPQVQPELWGKDVFSKIFHSMTSKGKMVTYCAKGVVRRTLENIGFKVERLPGPPGKREMLRATHP
jgi:tRNA U34 5-methylaminomethyl-2-thiouridine-forming methyltransferase MnmC